MRITIAGVLVAAMLVVVTGQPAFADHQNCGANYPEGTLSNGYPDPGTGFKSGWAGQTALNDIEAEVFAMAPPPDLSPPQADTPATAAVYINCGIGPRTSTGVLYGAVSVRGDEFTQGDPLPAEPFAVGAARSDLALELFVVDDPALLEVDEEHLAGLQPAFELHIGRFHIEDTHKPAQHMP